MTAFKWLQKDHKNEIGSVFLLNMNLGYKI